MIYEHRQRAALISPDLVQIVKADTSVPSFAVSARCSASHILLAFSLLSPWLIDDPGTLEHQQLLLLLRPLNLSDSSAGRQQLNRRQLAHGEAAPMTSRRTRRRDR